MDLLSFFKCFVTGKNHRYKSAKKNQEMLKLVGEKVNAEQDIYRGLNYLLLLQNPEWNRKKKKALIE